MPPRDARGAARSLVGLAREAGCTRGRPGSVTEASLLRRADECKVFSPSASPRAPGPRALHPPAMGGCSAKGPTSIAQRSHENTLHSSEKFQSSPSSEHVD